MPHTVPTPLDILKTELLAVVQQHVYIQLETPIRLASGRETTFYYDGKQVTLDPQHMHLFAKCVLQMIEVTSVDAIGGPTMGADPIASVVAHLALETHQRHLQVFYVRKDAKPHGLQRMIEGPSLKHNSRVVVVEDVITTGGSVKRAIEALEHMGCQVAQVISLVDREQGGADLLKPYNYTPLFTHSELQL